MSFGRTLSSFHRRIGIANAESARRKLEVGRQGDADPFGVDRTLATQAAATDGHKTDLGVRILDPSVIRQLQSELASLRQAIIGHQPSEADFKILEMRYRQHLIRWFDRLTFADQVREFFLNRRSELQRIHFDDGDDLRIFAHIFAALDRSIRGPACRRRADARCSDEPDSPSDPRIASLDNGWRRLLHTEQRLDAWADPSARSERRHSHRRQHE